MLAAVKTDKWRDIEVKELEEPILREGELLIRVDYCGVCGSDLHTYSHAKGYEFVCKPIILGHEFSGTVVECYDSTQNKWVGKRVIVESMQYCGKCENCIEGRKNICIFNQVIGFHYNGGMAQFVKSNQQYVREIPKEVSAITAAFSEPM